MLTYVHWFKYDFIAFYLERTLLFFTAFSKSVAIFTVSKTVLKSFSHFLLIDMTYISVYWTTTTSLKNVFKVKIWPISRTIHFTASKSVIRKKISARRRRAFVTLRNSESESNNISYKSDTAFTVSKNEFLSSNWLRQKWRFFVFLVSSLKSFNRAVFVFFSSVYNEVNTEKEDSGVVSPLGFDICIFIEM